MVKTIIFILILVSLVMLVGCTDANFRDDCDHHSSLSMRDLCLLDLSVEHNDHTICELSSNGQDNCYTYFAKIKNDSTKCDLIKNVPSNEICLKLFLTQVKNKTSEQKNTTVLNSENITLQSCSEITDSFQNDMCIDKVARTQNDFEMCDLISSGMYRDICKIHVAAGLNDPTLCDDAGYNSQVVCILNIAWANNDSTLCERFNKNRLDKCYLSYSYKKNDKSVCNLIQTEFIRNNCLNH